jgi:putative endonuclease
MQLCISARLGITGRRGGNETSAAACLVGAAVQVGRMTTLTRVQLGTMGEALAVDHLTRMGLRILHRNWRCRYGELDVIASDKSAELHRMQHCDEVENDLSCWWARVRGFRVTIGELP